LNCRSTYLKQAAKTTAAGRLLLRVLLLSDGEVLARGGFVLVADLVGDEAVLGLLRGALVVLRAAAEELLLDVVDA
jgi:hypothetical protein